MFTYINYGNTKFPKQWDHPTCLKQVISLNFISFIIDLCQ